MMALSEFEQRRYEKPIREWLARRRPPPAIRKKLDFGYRFNDQSVEIFEIRPAWRSPGEYMEHSVAKARLVKSQFRTCWRGVDTRVRQCRTQSVDALP